MRSLCRASGTAARHSEQVDCTRGGAARRPSGRSVDGCYDRDDDELARCSTAAPPPVAAADPDEPLAAAGVWALTNDRLLNNLYQPIAMLARLSESSLI